MAFPSVLQAQTFQKDDANADSFEVTIPSGLTNDNTLVVIFACDGDRTITMTADMDAQLANLSNTVSIRMAYKKIDGTEGSAVTVTTSGSERACAVAYEIQNAADPDIIAPEQSTNTGTSATPDPPNHAPSTGKDFHLWIAAVGVDRDRTIDSFPSDMTVGSSEQNVNGGGANSCSIGTDTHQDEVVSFNPNTFGISASDGWAALTLNIFPVSGNNQTLTATATGVPAIQLSVAKTLAVTAVANTGMSRKCFIPLSETAVGIATIATLRTAFVTAAATATAAVNLAKKVKIGLSPAATGIAALGRKIFKTLNVSAVGIATIVVNQMTALTEIALAATATAIAAVQLKTKKTLASTASGIAVLTTSSTFVVVLAATATGIVTLAKKARLGLSDTAAGIVTLARTAKLGLTVSATGIVDLARKVKIALGNTASGIAAIVVNALAGATLLTLTATATAIAALRITVKKPLQAVSVGIAALDPIGTFRVLLATVGTGIATLRTAATFRRAFAATATGLAALAKKPKLVLAATAAGIASINRTVFKTLRSTAEGVATVILATAILVALAAAAVGIPALALKVKRGLRATGAGVANIQRFVRKTLRSFAIGVAILNEEQPQPPSRLQRVLIGFFGGPGGGPGR